MLPLDVDPPDADEDWLSRACQACLTSLQDATAPADRLALLRELVRLHGGTHTLRVGQFTLQEEDAPLLGRFGLRCLRQADRLLLSVDPKISSQSVLDENLIRCLPIDRRSRSSSGEAVVGDAFLQRLTPFKVYRTPTQKAAARSAVLMPGSGSLLATMPTGAGKSLIFQLATLWWREGTSPGSACAVVVVPTIALALDHEKSARAFPGLEASRALTGTLTRQEHEDVLLSFRRGEIPLLFVSPEAALGSAREAILDAARPLCDKPEAAQARLVAFFVDEVHIVESWGRTFRPDFQRLPALLSALRQVNSDLRTVLLSATVSSSARDLLRASYGSGDWLEISAEVPRYEFDWVLHRCPDSVARQKLLEEVMDRLPRPAIVYTTTREDAQGLHAALVERGYRRLALFTGDTQGEDRRTIIQDWAQGRIDLVVATSAFGMGIDKTNVRAVIHACLPEDASRLYQEVGRGGRDGHQCLALTLWCEEDVEVASSMASKQWLTPETASVRWKAILDEAKDRRTLLMLDGHQTLRVRLNSAHSGIGATPGGRNREWNRSLINLLQRAGALEVLDSDAGRPDDPEWQVRILKPEMFSPDPAIMAQVLSLRDRERDEAMRKFRALRDVVADPEQECVLMRLFEMVEGCEAQACGHCAACLAMDVPPPQRVRYHGLDSYWPQRPPRQRLFPPGITIVHPLTNLAHGGLDSLVPRLSRAGLQQFVVPDGMGPDVLTILSRLSGLGLVLEFSMIRYDEWEAADMPTSVLVSEERPQTSTLLDWARKLAEQRPEQALVLVAQPHCQYQSRPVHVLSRQAPYSEEVLDDMIAAVRTVSS